MATHRSLASWRRPLDLYGSHKRKVKTEILDEEIPQPGFRPRGTGEKRHTRSQGVLRRSGPGAESFRPHQSASVVTARRRGRPRGGALTDATGLDRARQRNPGSPESAQYRRLDDRPGASSYALALRLGRKKSTRPAASQAPRSLFQPRLHLGHAMLAVACADDDRSFRAH